MLQNRFELIGCDRQIKKPIATRATFLVDLVEAFGQSFIAGLILKFALKIKKRLGKRLPDFIAHSLARKFSDGLFHFPPEVVIAFLAAGEADDGHGGRQLSIGRQIVERGHQLAMGEIASGPEDNDAARLRHCARGDSLSQWVRLCLLSCSIHESSADYADCADLVRRIFCSGPEGFRGRKLLFLK